MDVDLLGEKLLWMCYFLLMQNSSDEIKMRNGNNNNNGDHELPRSRCDACLFTPTCLQLCPSHADVNVLSYIL